MKNVTILLAVLALLAIPAYGDRAYWNGATADWEATPTNWLDWNTDLPCTPPGAGDRAEIGNGGTPQISSPVTLSQLCVGNYGEGHLEIGANLTLTDTNEVYVGFYHSTGVTSTITQTAGIFSHGWFWHIGYGASGKYTISGGELAVPTYRGTTLGAESGIGTFEVIGTGPAAIVVGNYVQNAGSTLAIELDAAGAVTVIDASDATLAGTLQLDASAYSGGAKVIDVLAATGALDYSALTLAGAPAGSTLTNTGSTLQINYVPEPVTMCLLCIGGLGVLIRRKHR